MRKIVFWAHGDCVGTDTKELVVFEDVNNEQVTDEFLNSYAEDFGRDWAGQWEPSCGGEDDDYEHEDEYWENCGWGWQEYEPAKHNGEISPDSDGYEGDDD